MIITPVSTTSPEGQEKLNSLYDRFQLADTGCRQTVSDVLHAIRTEGDAALVRYIRKFDAPDFELAHLRVTPEEFDQAYKLVDKEFMATLKIAIERIRVFHENEMEKSWTIDRPDGAMVGRLVRSVDSAGLYVPGGQGGKTPLVSSVLMNGLPARIAGVERRVMMTPPASDGTVNPALLVAAREIGIDEVYKAGSAWAIAALAFGTESIHKVDVIVGPGNQYVTEAKRQVSGMVRIDMIAGPSEVLIVADHTAEPAFIAADMIAQAEHDPQALAVLITTDEGIGAGVIDELDKQLKVLSREDIARRSLADRGVVMIAPGIDEAIDLANKIAVEHLELMFENSDQWLDKIRHAGAIFLGKYSPEAAGDYLAGPNHVLPTMGTARFSSALGVETFLKKSSVISYSKEAFLADAEHIRRLAELEGLTGHANSVAVRIKSE